MVVFGGMVKGKITIVGKIGIPTQAFIHKILYVKDLKYNLLSISQLCDMNYIVSFNKDQCIVKTKDGKSFFTARWNNNLNEIDLIYHSKHNITYLLFREDERWIWHRKLGHVNLKHISKVSKNDLVRGLSKIC